jgi:hypothetical protein
MYRAMSLGGGTVRSAQQFLTGLGRSDEWPSDEHKVSFIYFGHMLVNDLKHRWEERNEKKKKTNHREQRGA